jgi:hypothetical protein
MDLAAKLRDIAAAGSGLAAEKLAVEVILEGA